MILNGIQVQLRKCEKWGLTLLRKNKFSKEITNKTGAIAPIMFGSTLR